MKRLPMKYSKSWFYVLTLLTVIVFFVFEGTQAILNKEAMAQLSLGFAILAIGSTLLIALGGFLGARYYFIISCIGVGIGLLYRVVVILTDKTTGWSDLISIAGYIMCIAMGILGGIMLEIGIWIYGKQMEKKKGIKHAKL